MYCIENFKNEFYFLMNNLKMKPGSKPSPSLAINLDLIKKASALFRAADHPLRQKMMQFIHQNLRVDVKTIYKNLKLEQSVTSQHLSILRNAKLVSTERSGKFVYYSINYEKIKNLHRTAGKMIEK